MSNKHKHHDLIAEWIKDTSKKYQCRNVAVSPEFKDCSGTPIWDPRLEYREKPRDFEKGHWYPCSRVDREFFARYDGTHFVEPSNEYNVDSYIRWLEINLTIGKSLGVIDFEK